MQVHHVDFHVDHPQALGARVDIVQARLDCLEVPAELLVDALVALGDDFVRVVDKTATYAGHPCAHTSAYFTPGHHALAIKGDLVGCVVDWGKLDVFWLTVQAVMFLHFEGVCILLP